MNLSKLFPLFVPVFLVFTLYLNGAAASGALGGIPTGDISDQYQVLFTPAGYVFSIWSLIYTGLIAFSLFQLKPLKKKNTAFNTTRLLFLVSCIFNSLWIILWQYQYLVASLPVMIALLSTLIGIYIHEGIGASKVSTAHRWFVHAPFSLYLGWISVATIANTALVLYVTRWSAFGLSDIAWTIIMMAVAAILGAIMLINQRDYIFAGVIIWALVGIAVKNQGTSTIETTVFIGVLILTAVALIRPKLMQS